MERRVADLGRLIVLFLILLTGRAYAAAPAFGDFDPAQFQINTSQPKIQLLSGGVVSNYVVVYITTVVTVSSNVFTTNLFTTNIFVTTINSTTIVNSNLFTTNIITETINNITNISQTTFVTNLFVDNSITTNLTVNYFTVNSNANIVGYIRDFAGIGTNTTLYSPTLVTPVYVVSSNGPAVWYFLDADNQTVLAGFDTNRGGLFGMGLVWTNDTDAHSIYPNDNTNNPPYAQFFNKKVGGGSELHLESETGVANIGAAGLRGFRGDAEVFGNILDDNGDSWGWDLYSFGTAPTHTAFNMAKPGNFLVNIDPMLDNGIEAFRFNTESNVANGDLLFSVGNQGNNKLTLMGAGGLTVNSITNTSLTASQFIVTDANKAEASTLNGSALTNLTYQFTTNPVTTGNGTATWDVSKPRQALATNANITISLANVPTTTDKLSNLILTNNGAAASTITITLSGFWVMSNGVPVTSLILTNNDSKQQRMALSVDCYASQYTNAAYYNIYSP